MDLTSERPLQTAFKSALGRFVTRITCFLKFIGGAFVCCLAATPLIVGLFLRALCLDNFGNGCLSGSGAFW
ncbi:hypothetical protein DN756_19240 [Yersinia pseudotuberculosis]|nr:hypothetical protein DN756_19240 [Yersinia pseudotuberculosis]